MLRNIAFLGGIHGVGKSTICKSICVNSGLVYLSASDILKWKEFNPDGTSKKVSDIAHTQSRLIHGLALITTAPAKYLLDGHYCLLNREGVIENVPVEIFRQINPFSLNLIVDEVSIIKDRLEKRDDKPYDLRLLEKMQHDEISHARDISGMLQVKLNICKPNNVAEIVNSINQFTL